MGENFHFKAVLFDLDGVVTDTARVHASAWKTLFDTFLKDRKGEKVMPFDLASDYLAFIDGKPRYDGVSSFLQSRSISLPFGHPDDLPSDETLCGLGNRKDLIFSQELYARGVKVFESSRRLILELKSYRIGLGVVSSSKNCQRVLQVAGLEDLFDVRVDGQIAVDLGLKGKPDPAMFLKGAELLGVSPKTTVVIEDAVPGVQAAARGGFALIVGLDRQGTQSLGQHGADLVLSDLDNISASSLDEYYCRRGRVAF